MHVYVIIFFVYYVFRLHSKRMDSTFSERSWYTWKSYGRVVYLYSEGVPPNINLKFVYVYLLHLCYNKNIHARYSSNHTFFILSSLRGFVFLVFTYGYGIVLILGKVSHINSTKLNSGGVPQIAWCVIRYFCVSLPYNCVLIILKRHLITGTLLFAWGILHN